jgi:hypothetical protein
MGLVCPFVSGESHTKNLLLLLTAGVPDVQIHSGEGRIPKGFEALHAAPRWYRGDL